MLNTTLVISMASSALKGTTVALGDSGLELSFDSVKDTKDGVMAKFTDGEGVLLFATLDSIVKLNIKYPEEEDSPKYTIEECVLKEFGHSNFHQKGNTYKLSGVENDSSTVKLEFVNIINDGDTIDITLNRIPSNASQKAIMENIVESVLGVFTLGNEILEVTNIEELCTLIYEDNKEKVLLSRETGNMFKLESVTEISMGIAVAFEHVYGMEGGDVLLLNREFIEENTMSDVVSAVEEKVEERFVELVPKDTLTIPEDSEDCQCVFCTAEE